MKKLLGLMLTIMIIGVDNEKVSVYAVCEG